MSDLFKGLLYGILGPVVLWRENHEVNLNTRPARIFLARMLLAVGNAVHTDQIVDAIYGSRPPKSARNQIQKSASELRSKGVEVVERGGAYLLSLAPDTLDANRFTELVTQARILENAQNRSRALRRAEAMWRGPAFAGLDDSVFRSVAAEWDEKRLVALAERIEAEMLCHQYDQVIPELRRLLLEHPMNERLHALFMVACHHTGRVSEATRCYSALRYRLADELGIDPPVMLQALHEMILQQDRALFGIATLHQIEALATAPATTR